VTFKCRWLLNRGDLMGMFDCICLKIRCLLNLFKFSLTWPKGHVRYCIIWAVACEGFSHLVVINHLLVTNLITCHKYALVLWDIFILDKHKLMMKYSYVEIKMFCYVSFMSVYPMKILELFKLYCLWPDIIHILLLKFTVPE
jgi:hypothetical protein